MFGGISNFLKKIFKNDVEKEDNNSKNAAKERLHLVLMQDRANVSADFLELMKQEIIDVIKKYIVVDDNAIDVRLTNQANDDGTNGAPALYANIPILNIRNDIKAEKIKEEKETEKEESVVENENENEEENQIIVEEEKVEVEVEEKEENNTEEIAEENDETDEEEIEKEEIEEKEVNDEEIDEEETEEE
ncbi:MAG: cell division topological specificity factor MinE [Clostridia bacterium]|nr:cell division topological specificity factor MinE [Clostridia bacterium]